jgi:LysM repeat protein
MSAQSAEQRPSEQTQDANDQGMTFQVYSQTDSGHRGPTLQQCPHCGAVTASGATVCQECGEDLTRKSKTIRCRQCGHRAPAELVICPHCGRELKPAPPRLLTWGAPILLIALFLFLLFARGNPLSGWSQQVEKAVTFVVAPADSASVSGAVAVITPVPAENPAAPADPSSADASPSQQNIVEAAALLPTATEQTPTDTPQPTATEAPTAAPTETPTEAPTKTPPSTPTRATTATPVPTSTKTATATAKATSQPIITPTATSVVKPTATPTSKPALQLPTATSVQAAPQEVIYTVKPGDTLIAIAISFDVTTRELMDANGIDPGEVYAIRPGQELIVPTGTGGNNSTPPPPAPTDAPTSTEVPTATPAPTKPAYRLDAPQLRSPEDGAAVSCQGTHALTWGPVAYILGNDKYILHLGFVSGRDAAGKETVTWILNQASPPVRTSWEMDNQLCALAPQDMGRQWRWYVEVVDQSSASVSPPSETWGFSWK